MHSLSYLQFLNGHTTHNAIRSLWKDTKSSGDAEWKQVQRVWRKMMADGSDRQKSIIECSSERRKEISSPYLKEHESMTPRPIIKHQMLNA
eukprot:TRINITY_DN5985_c0_g1_i1.p2 TRINITY_DN5985_c0_g1~~TRINITY_DN5985_c0_g1_i1.p2  ORF type:complete len:91 (-),score=12.24 TRINITY_DN5985_c0_g1_i1:122-394(-)